MALKRLKEKSPLIISSKVFEDNLSLSQHGVSFFSLSCKSYCETLNRFKSLVKKLVHLRIKNKLSKNTIILLAMLYVLQTSLISFSFVTEISDLRGLFPHRAHAGKSSNILIFRVNSRLELLRLLVE